MSHEITVRKDGFAEAAFSLTPAWHGLGQVFDHTMKSKEAFIAAGLDWEVHQIPAYMGWDDAQGQKKFEQVPGHMFNVRSDNREVLGMVSDHYKIVQNTEAFAFLDALVENHEMEYESAFSLYGGRKVVVLARRPGFEQVVEGDAILPYILLSLGHDGTEAIKFGPVATRVVCANTYAMALGEGGVKEMSIRHSGDIQSKLAQARDILGVASKAFEDYAETGRQLAQRRLSWAEWTEYLDIMCPELDPRDPDWTELRAKRLAETRASIMDAYTNDRQRLNGIVQSAWAAYNAVSEHIDHLPRRGASPERKAEARFNTCLYGVGRDMKHRALEAACRFAGIELVV